MTFLRNAAFAIATLLTLVGFAQGQDNVSFHVIALTGDAAPDGNGIYRKIDTLLGAGSNAGVVFSGVFDNTSMAATTTSP